jgi:hypothetical protein
MTDYLFAKPNFIGGMARLLDLGSTLNVYNDSPSEEIADMKALKSDWMAVGNDMRFAIKKSRRRKR